MSTARAWTRTAHMRSPSGNLPWRARIMSPLRFSATARSRGILRMSRMSSVPICLPRRARRWEKGRSSISVRVARPPPKQLLLFADMFGGEIVYGPARIEAHDSLADNRKAQELLGWKPLVGLEDGIMMLKKEMGIT